MRLRLGLFAIESQHGLALTDLAFLFVEVNVIPRKSRLPNKLWFIPDWLQICMSECDKLEQ